eukprot:m51a1_g5113 hypothetical protein (163) ;mRNA; r:348280-348954
MAETEPKAQQPEDEIEADSSDDDNVRGDEEPDLYDSDEDAKDEKWVNAHLRPPARPRVPPAAQPPVQQQTAAPPSKRRSDATLNCPGCFALLTMDCQRHCKYADQYRAMFVRNCAVDRSERLREPGAPEDQFYWRVACEHCGASVGVLDSDDVYHFFGVFAS